MKLKINRRSFVKTASLGGLSIGLAGKMNPFISAAPADKKRAGIIGLDTSHVVAFTKALNASDAGPEFNGYKIVAAYPKGSNDIKSSTDRIPGYTEDVRKLGVEIVNSIEELLPKVDVVFLETNDGRLHLEQALKVIKAGKRMFIDKPIAASLADAISIFRAAAHYKVPIFSSSSLRFTPEIIEINKGKVGKVLGADIYGPSSIEKTHPDLFWYGVHGVEMLNTVMGIGCKNVTMIQTEFTDKVIGVWEDGRIGSFRGTRNGKYGFGGTVFGENGFASPGDYQGYNALLARIIEFFNTGEAPVPADETINIFAFMTAAQESKINGGIAVTLKEVLEKAEKEAMVF
jgi:predicted dehydrogenase